MFSWHHFQTGLSLFFVGFAVSGQVYVFGFAGYYFYAVGDSELVALLESLYLFLYFGHLPRILENAFKQRFENSQWFIIWVLIRIQHKFNDFHADSLIV